jgi:hypothetical protein
MIAIRALQLLLFAAIAILVLATLHQAGLASRWRIPIFCALVAYGFEPAFSIYNLLSTVLLLAVLRAALEWQWSGQTRWLWLAGVLAGLEFGAKQNVAVLAAVALGVPLLLRGEWRGLVRVTAGFTAAAAVVAAAVWTEGGWTQFLEYGFMAKGNLLAVGLPLSATVARFLSGMRAAPTWTYQFRLLYSFLALAAAAGCLALVAAAWLRTRGLERQEMSFGAGFTAAAAITLYPIADLSHLAYAFPVLLLGAGLAAARMGFDRRWAQTAALCWFVPATLWLALSPALYAATGKMIMMRLPHYWGVPMRTSDYYPLARKVRTLRNAVDAGHRPYLITMHAGFYYLVTGLVNPTPFDYPAASAFGRQGEAHLIDALRRREIAEACIDPEYDHIFFAPRKLPPFVRRKMRPLEDLGACILYGW